MTRLPGYLAHSVAVLAWMAALTGPVTAAAPACNLPVTGTITALPWAEGRLSLSRVWPLTEGAGVVVAVVDSGVDAGHPALVGRVRAGATVAAGSGPATADCVGHGTFVAGLIAAARQPGVGFAGVAPRATIVPVRQTTDGQDGTVDTLADGIRAAVNLGAQVINVSITADRSTARLADAITYAQEHDVVVVAAAGNSDGGGTGDAVYYPAGYPGVLAVGAIDANDQLTGFSRTRTPVSVVAPGADLVGPGAGGAGLVAGREGTSYAAPFAAGVAALIRAYRPELRADQVVRRIEVTADHPGGPLPRSDYGWGVVNPYHALTQELPEEYAAAAAPAVRAAVVPASPTPSAERDGPAGLLSLGFLGFAAVIVTGAVALRARRRAGGRAGARGADA
jgi:membrane-anchored mycosin MYCP